MYQTLYRKYRPFNFDEVMGQKVIVQTLKNAIINHKLSHAYLFTGPRGTGKTSIAKILAKTINCESLINEYLPCNECVNCTQNTQNPVDIIEIDAASNNGVDEIRELRNKINLVPSIGKYKIYIIDEVHMLSTGAFNALLKTLEEPPNHIIFILATTDPHKIPSTILSRCQRFDFKKLTEEEITRRMQHIVNLETIEISEIALKEIAKLSDGGMRDSLSLLDQVTAYADDQITLEDIHEINGTVPFQEMNEFLKLLLNNNMIELFDKINQYNLQGKDFIKLTEELIVHLRDILLAIHVPNLLEDTKIDKEILNCFNAEKIMEYIRQFNNALLEMKHANNVKIIFELTLLKLLTIKQVEQNDKVPKDINNVIKIRINNTLCNFNKKELVAFKPLLQNLKNKQLEKKYAEYISLILDSKLKALGKNYMIFVLEKEKYVEIYNSNLDTIDELFEDIYQQQYKTIAVDEKEWDKIKKQFNNKEKEYVFINE